MQQHLAASLVFAASAAVASAQGLTGTATAATQLQVSANYAAPVTAPAGTTLPSGYVLRGTGSGGGLAQIGITLNTDAASQTLTYVVDDLYAIGALLGVALYPLSSGTGPHSTLLAVTAN